MDDRALPATRPAAHDLSHAEAFALGPLAVDPPSRRISTGDRSEMLEPRVMRVLVALGEAGGKVLSRDDLIEQCWDGVVVGDNAINQVISRLRHVFADLGGEAVRLETITKVGFRLVVDGQAAHAGAASGGAGVPFWHRTATRRAAMAGLVAAGGAGVYAAWFRPRSHVPDPRAVELYQRGQAIQKAGQYENMGEAIKLYRQAVTIDPRYAPAWAGIAIGLRYPVMGAPMRLANLQEVRVAAGRALALDPDNGDAQLALIVGESSFGRLERETRLRAFLDNHPDSALGNAMLCFLMQGVGRLEEALAAARRVIEIDPAQQIGWTLQVGALTNAGRFPEAELVLAQARSRWPQDALLWMIGNGLLLESKQYAAAIAYLRDANRRPATIPAAVVERVVRQHEALATGHGMTELANLTRTTPAATLMEQMPYPVTVAVLSGMADQAFALLEAYFFGGELNGKRVPPPGPLDLRLTFVLFTPAVISLRSDPRHASLLERTGLEDYWRKSGTQPDFRRGG